MRRSILRAPSLSAVTSVSKPVERICHTIQVRVVEIRVGVRGDHARGMAHRHLQQLQGGAQPRRAAPLSGPAARPSLGAGRPGNQSLSSAEDDPWAGIPATCRRPPRLVDGCSYSPLNVASELVQLGHRTSRPGRTGPGRALRPRPSRLHVYEFLPAAEGTVPLLIGAIVRLRDRTGKGRLRRHYMMASPPLTRPLVSTGSPV
jgi:hypothetical protein